MDIQTILREPNVNIIDVREPYEFSYDAVDGAKNMPLSQFGNYISEIQGMPGKKVLYCRSGNRSGQAVAYLRSIGINDAFNGGSVGFMQSFLVR